MAQSGMRSTIPLLVKEVTFADVLTTTPDGDPALMTTAPNLDALGEITDSSSTPTVIGLLKSIVVHLS